MSLRIGVLGATGVYGRHLVPAADYRRLPCPRALVRRPEAASVGSRVRSRAAAADIFDEASLRAALADCDIAINLATSLPWPHLNGRLREERRAPPRRHAHPVRACCGAGVPRILQQSIAMTHAGGGDAWADETTFHTVGEEGVAASAISGRARDGGDD